MEEPRNSFLGDLRQEAGNRTRRRLSSSGQDMVSTLRKRNKEDFDMESVVKAVAQNLLMPMMSQQSNNMTDLVSFLSSSMVKSNQGEKEKDSKPEEPKLVEMSDFSEETDDAIMTFAVKARNALRPFCCPPDNYWGKMDRWVRIKIFTNTFYNALQDSKKA